MVTLKDRFHSQTQKLAPPRQRNKQVPHEIFLTRFHLKVVTLKVFIYSCNPSWTSFRSWQFWLDKRQIILQIPFNCKLTNHITRQNKALNYYFMCHVTRIGLRYLKLHLEGSITHTNFSMLGRTMVVAIYCLTSLLHIVNICLAQLVCCRTAFFQVQEKGRLLSLKCYY